MRLGDPFTQAINPFTAGERDEQIKKVLQGAEQMLREAAIATLLNPEGLRMLDILEDLYNNQPCYAPGTPKGYGPWREGQNSVVRRLRAIINQAQNVIQTEVSA